MRTLSPPNYYLEFVYPSDWYDVASEYGFILSDTAAETFLLGEKRINDLLWKEDAKYYLIFNLTVPKGTTEAQMNNFETEIRGITSEAYYIEYRYTEDNA